MARFFLISYIFLLCLVHIMELKQTPPDFNKALTCIQECKENNNCGQLTQCNEQYEKNQLGQIAYEIESCKMSRIQQQRGQNEQQWADILKYNEQCMYDMKQKAENKDLKSVYQCSGECFGSLIYGEKELEQKCRKSQNCYENLFECLQKNMVNDQEQGGCKNLNCFDNPNQYIQIKQQKCKQLQKYEMGDLDMFDTVDKEYLDQAIQCLDLIKDQFQNQDKVLKFLDNQEKCYIEAKNKLQN